MARSFAHLDIGGLSDPGRCRQNNEDAIALLEGAGVFCVSDGVGGQAGGEIASKAIVDGLLQVQAIITAEKSFAIRYELLRQSLKKTNDWIWNEAAVLHTKGMGATIVLLAFDPEYPDHARILHAGDSRGYCYRNGQLVQLTVDHNMGNVLGEKKDEISAKLAGALTQAVGIAQVLELSETPITVELNDLFLLCSDGLTKMLSDQQIAEILQASKSLSAAGLSKRLVDMANEAGGKDNVSVIVIKADASLPLSSAIGLEALLPLTEPMKTTPQPCPSPMVVPDVAHSWINFRIVVIAALLFFVLAMLLGGYWQRQNELANNRKYFEREFLDAEKALNQRNYDLALNKANAAAIRFSSESDEWLAVRALQKKISSDKRDRTQRFESVLADAEAAQARGDLAMARARARMALELFPEDSKEWQQAQTLIDRLNDGERTKSSQWQNDYAAAVVAARTALERQDYAGAQKSAGTAITLCAAGSPDAEIAKGLQAKAETGLQERRQRFTAALTATNEALAKNDFAGAQQQATVASGLCQPDSLEATQLRDATDRIAAAQKRDGERQQEQLTAALTAAKAALDKGDLAGARQHAETAKRLAPAGAQAVQASLLLDAITAAGTAASQTTELLAKRREAQTVAIAQAQAALAQQNYAGARKAVETANANSTPGTPEAETVKALLAQVEAGEQLQQRRQRFEVALTTTRAALAQKDLVTAKQQADMALAIFSVGSPEWQQAKSLADDIVKGGIAGDVVIPSIGVNQPVVSPVAGFGLVGLFNGKPGASSTDLMNKTCYMRVNLWDDRVGITTLNIHNGPMIAVGTPVSSVQVLQRKLCFVVNGTPHAIMPSGYVRIKGGEDFATLQHRYFAEDNPKISPVYQQFTQVEKEAIEKGFVATGMSKEAVLMAYGYPSSHKTTSLEANTWFYWENSKATMPIEINFENGRTVLINYTARAKTALAQQNYVSARQALKAASVNVTPGTPEAETIKGLLAQVEAGEQLQQRRQRFEVALTATRTAMAQKDLVTAKQQADMALAIFPVGSPEWQQAQGLAHDIAKTTADGTVERPGGITPPSTLINTREVVLPGNVKLELCPCPAGTFTMGSPVNEPGRMNGETQHKVTLTKSFWLGKTEVTQAQWQSLMGNNPATFKAPDHPVESVLLADVVSFCKKLTEQEVARIPVGYEYRLPTEAEWEYACRAGSKGAYGGTGNIDDMGWCSDNSERKTNPVGKKQPNAWGLYDMHGNVYEWCRDACGDYPVGDAIDPIGPAPGESYVLRGGCLFDKADKCRSAARNGNVLACRYFNLGFRVALAPVIPKGGAGR